MRCVQKPLAQRGSYRVEACDECGGVSVHVGPMTMCLDANGLRTLEAVLREAAANLQGATHGLLLPKEAGASPVN